jgi:predicted outer membrane repeat protein
LADAIAAAAANGPAEDTIRLANNQAYSQTAVTIVSQKLTIAGGFATCAAPAPSGTTTLDGTGGSASPVIEIDGGIGNPYDHQVYLNNLVISGGEQSGVFVHGATDTTLNRVLLTANSADSGGGLRADGAIVSILLSTIEYNVADNGGGLSCANQAVLNVSTATDVRNNTATLGGGIYADDCGVSLLGYALLIDPGDAIVSVSNNHATSDGGGIYAVAGAHVSMMGANSPGSARVQDNDAGLRGGGLYLSDSGTNLFTNAGWVVGNSAGNGGGLYLGGDAYVDFQRGIATCHGARCSRLSGHHSGVGGTGFGGGAYVSSSTRYVTESEISGNDSDYGGALFVAGAAATLRLANDVVAKNVTTASAIPSGALQVGTGGDLNAWQLTIADNSGAGNAVRVNSGASLVLYDSIVFNNSGAVLSNSGTAAAGCLLVNDSAGLPAGATEVTVGDPLFTNAAASDYRLTPASPAVDYCETLPATPPFDIDLDTRPYDWPGKTALYGPVDLGANELGNTIFIDGLE